MLVRLVLKTNGNDIKDATSFLSPRFENLRIFTLVPSPRRCFARSSLLFLLFPLSKPSHSFQCFSILALINAFRSPSAVQTVCSPLSKACLEYFDQKRFWRWNKSRPICLDLVSRRWGGHWPKLERIYRSHKEICSSNLIESWLFWRRSLHRFRVPISSLPIPRRISRRVDEFSTLIWLSSQLSEIIYFSWSPLLG